MDNKASKSHISKIDDLIHYKDIFTNKSHTKSRTKSHTKSHKDIKLSNKNNSILLLKKKEFDIFYSCKLKYPLLVVETVNAMTGKTDPNAPPIDRREIEDPFREDIDIPHKSQHALNDYKLYMEYGGSMGHNAAAGQHKTNLQVYYDTFLLSNITPQEIVFNSGLWVIMENWCKYLGQIRNIQITNIRVITGSVPAEKDTNLNGVKMNIPTKMYKIVCFEIVNQPQTTFMEILISTNQAYYVNPHINKFALNSFLLATTSQKWFQHISGINIASLLKYYGYNNNNIKPFRTLISMGFMLSPPLKKLMKKSNWYGYLIYASSLEQLEHKWQECKKFEKEFETLEYHKEYYELTKKRLLRDKTHIIDLQSFKNGCYLFNRLNYKHTQQSHHKQTHKHTHKHISKHTH